MSTRRPAGALVATCLALLSLAIGSGCAAGDPMEVRNARMGVPIAGASAVYLTVLNRSGRDDVLVGARTEFATVAYVHRSMIDASGVVNMDAAEGIAIPDGRSVGLEPGGDHLMLVDAQPLEEGQRIPITLIFKTFGEVQTEVEVSGLIQPDVPT